MQASLPIFEFLGLPGEAEREIERERERKVKLKIHLFNDTLGNRVTLDKQY